MQNLQRRAREKLKAQEGIPEQDISNLTRPEIEKALHELQVYQVELELQNEELSIAQTELVLMRDKYQFLFDFAPVGYVSFGLNGLIEQSNITFAEMIGQGKANLPGRSFRNFLHADDAQKFYHHRKLLVETLDPQEFEIRLIKKSRRIFPAQITIKLDDPKTPKQILGIITDISVLKNAEEKIRASENRLKLRNRVAEAFLTSGRDEKVYAEVLRLLLDHFASAYGYFGYINENSDLVVPSMSDMMWNKCEVKEKSIIFPRNEWGGLWGDSLLKKQILFSNQDLSPPEGHIQLDNAIAAPVMLKDELLGQIVLANRKTGFQSGDVKDLEEVTAYIAPVLKQKLQEEKIKNLQTEAERINREHLEFLKTLINTIPNPVFYYDKDGKLIGFNDAFAEFIGVSREDLTGETIDGIWIGRYLKQHKEDIDRVKAQGGKLIFECKLRNDQDLSREVICYNTAFSGVVLGTLIDITPLKMRERELKELNKTKDKFFSIISHDLKNPFGALIGFVNMLYEDYHEMDREEIFEFVKKINAAAENTFKLLDNLLHWSRIQTGRTGFNPEIVDIGLLVEELIMVAGPQAKSKNININNSINDGITAWADRNMVEMVMRNLLTNAIKFTREDGFVEFLANEVSGPGKRKMIEISIRDTGIGISNEHLLSLFEVGDKVKMRGTAGEQGTGLGLLLCKEFVIKCGGTIEAESEFGKGSTFKFTVPMALSEE